MCTLKPDVLLTRTEYGMALLDQKRAEYWTLNPTAALVLQTLLDGHGTERAVASLVERYEGVDAETAAQDVTRIVDDLSSAGLIAP
ncbi:lasso peptide biosynthesis PqqD family chaperone [Streptomyces sp. TLI_146]|uniref:lasso peptide biosynthesis PqqD family chaperone n=1 Tax=Streptomyces sp. TLI_146 TaxID=1938858 RepID=UPI000C7121BA|nr:lasso peptide biosynthesis PqqD family chaperone [Streptomyces sp. TLI_146]PKV89209.1 coenzyme PQQ synthesis protein D (PqqD) [Streptomyces sp. TLI_146]